MMRMKMKDDDVRAQSCIVLVISKTCHGPDWAFESS